MSDYLEDNGFTQRVLDALPKRDAPSPLRGRVLLGAGGAAIVAFVLGPGRVLASELLTPHMSWAALVAATVTVLVGAGTAVSVALREAQS